MVLLALLVFSTPLWILGTISIMREQPVVRPIIVQPISPLPPVQQNMPSFSFMSGYWDGWHGKWLGPIRWTLNDEYRQGHMLGTYDRKKGIHRYSPR